MRICGRNRPPATRAPRDPAEDVAAVPVGRYVGNPHNEGPRCFAS